MIMRRIFIVCFITSIWLYSSCTDKPRKLVINQMKIEIEIIPESTNGSYSISWNDTLCSKFNSDWNYLQKRPYELYCHIFDNVKDTIGYYRGLSTPQRFTYFQTKNNTDSIIYLKFSIGINYFSENIENSNVNSYEPIEFRAIKIDLRKNVKKKMDIVLIRPY